MADCLFCKIVTGDIPAERVAESGRTIAFRDINPQAPTHVLVIPKDHHPDLAAGQNLDPRHHLSRKFKQCLCMRRLFALQHRRLPIIAGFPYLRIKLNAS